MAVATAGAINGTALLLTVGTTVIAHTTDFTLSVDGAVIDTTTRNSAGWKESLQGMRSWSITANGLVAYDDVAGFLALLQGPINRLMYAAKLTTGLVGDPIFSGNVHITKVTSNAKMEAAVTFTATLEGSGPLTLGTN